MVRSMSSSFTCARNCILPSQVAHRGQSNAGGTRGTPPVRVAAASGAPLPAYAISLVTIGTVA
jgi:hypothetical protein